MILFFVSSDFQMWHPCLLHTKVHYIVATIFVDSEVEVEKDDLIPYACVLNIGGLGMSLCK